MFGVAKCDEAAFVFGWCAHRIEFHFEVHLGLYDLIAAAGIWVVRNVRLEYRFVASHLMEHVELLRDRVVPFVPFWESFCGGESGVEVGTNDAFGGVDCWLRELNWSRAVATVSEKDAVGGAMGDGVLEVAARDAGCRSSWFVERLWEVGVGDGWGNVGGCRWWGCGCSRGGGGGCLCCVVVEGEVERFGACEHVAADRASGFCCIEHIFGVEVGVGAYKVDCVGWIVGRGRGVGLRWVEERDFEKVDVCAFRGFCAPPRE